MHATPLADKHAVVGIKPYLGGKKYNPKSPDRAAANLFSSVQNIEDPTQNFNTEREIQEEIGVLEDTVESSRQKPKDVDPTDTQTSEFYQIPISGGLPVKLTIDNSRRPFTPPFAQLTKINAQKPDSKQSNTRKGPAGQKLPEWVAPATKSIIIPQGK